MVLVAVCGSLILVEAMLALFPPDVGRLAWSDGESAFFALDPGRIYGLRASASFPPSEHDSRLYRTDSLGLRFNPLPLSPGGTAKTILMIGDSFTFGKGVTHEEAFPARVQSRLVSSGIDATVLNAGVPGYGIDQEYQYLMEELLPRYDPDVIVWNLNANDIDDTNKACLYVLQGNTLTKVSAKRNMLYMQGVVSKRLPGPVVRSRTFRFGIHALNTLVGSDRYTFGCSLPIRGPRTLIQRSFQQKLSRYVRDVERYASSHDIKLLVTIMPFEFYFDPMRTEDVIFSDYRVIADSIRSIFPAVIDLNEELASESDPQLRAFRSGSVMAGQVLPESVLGTSSGFLREELYLSEDNPFDGAHLNADGNDRIARHITQVLSALMKD